MCWDLDFPPGVTGSTPLCGCLSVPGVSHRMAAHVTSEKGVGFFLLLVYNSDPRSSDGKVPSGETGPVSGTMVGVELSRAKLWP